MADVRTAWAPETAPTAADWLMDPPGLEVDRDLETAVILSLFTDAAAAPNDTIPDGTDDRRGWWGNAGPVGDQAAPPEGAMGSRLWLLSREKSTERTRRRAEEYAAAALAWLTADGAAARVDVKASWLTPGTPPFALGLWIRILRDDGNVFSRRYAWAWEQLFVTDAAAIPPPPPPPEGVGHWNVDRWRLGRWGGTP